MGRLPSAERVDECLERAGQGDDRLTSMVERLLEWARMEAGKRVYHTVARAASASLDGALSALEPRLQARAARRRGQASIAQIADHLPLVDVDPDAMSRRCSTCCRTRCATPATRRHPRALRRARARGRDHHRRQRPRHLQARAARIFEKFYRVVDPAQPERRGHRASASQWCTTSCARTPARSHRRQRRRQGRSVSHRTLPAVAARTTLDGRDHPARRGRPLDLARAADEPRRSRASASRARATAKRRCALRASTSPT